MYPSVGRLLTGAAGESVVSEPPDRAVLPQGRLFSQLFDVLTLRNGFYAFTSALHFFGAGSPAVDAEHSISRWNDPDLWGGDYGRLAEGLYFFGEDVFGGQFAVDGEEIVLFDPESGRREVVATDFNQWAEAIIADYPVLTGSPLAMEWQEAHGPIPVGYRLVPKLPFALGGTFDLTNLALRDAVAGMKFRADLARQMDGVPDGTSVRIRVTPWPE